MRLRIKLAGISILSRVQGKALSTCGEFSQRKQHRITDRIAAEICGEHAYLAWGAEGLHSPRLYVA